VPDVITRGNVYFIGYYSAAATVLPKRTNAPTAPTVGTILPILKGSRLAGPEAVIDYTDARPLLLYYWSPTCIWCTRNADNMRLLTAGTRGRYAFIAMTGAAVSPKDAERMGLSPEAVVANVPSALLREAHLGVTPQLLVVGTDGKIENVWSGALSGGALHEVENLFGLTLPGVTRW
jgi:hypothetical protein